MTDQKSWTVVKEEFVLFNNVVLNRTWQIMFQNFFQNWMQFYWFTTRRQSFCFKRKSFLNRSSAESRFPHHHCWVSEIICRAAVCYKSSSLHHRWSKAVRKASGGICLRFHIWDLDLLRLIYHHFFPPVHLSHTYTLDAKSWFEKEEWSGHWCFSRLAVKMRRWSPHGGASSRPVDSYFHHRQNWTHLFDLLCIKIVLKVNRIIC